MGTCREIDPMLRPKSLIGDESTLVQVMAWCRQATSHYLSQFWSRSVLPYNINRPQWFKANRGHSSPVLCVGIFYFLNTSSKLLCTHWFLPVTKQVFVCCFKIKIKFSSRGNTKIIQIFNTFEIRASYHRLNHNNVCMNLVYIKNLCYEVFSWITMQMAFWILIPWEVFIIHMLK